MTDKLIDFSNCEINYGCNYGGSDRKFGIFYQGTPYMIKFSENSKKKNVLATSSINNCISEYIGSRIAKSVGLQAHDTQLGYYNGELVVACKDFCSKNQVSWEFSDFMRMKYDSSDIGKLPKIEQIYDVISNVPIMVRIKEEAINRYWDTFVVDALLANFDRHKGNWGYIVNPNEGTIMLAPTYDYGSTLYPSASDDGIDAIISSPKEICERIFVFPNAALLVNNVKVSYYDMLTSGYDKHCSEAIKRVVPKMDMDVINAIIDETPLISDERKNFYKTILFFRKELILDNAYECVRSGEFNEMSYTRIKMGIPYTKQEFFIDWDSGSYNSIKDYIEECSTTLFTSFLEQEADTEKQEKRCSR